MFRFMRGGGARPSVAVSVVCGFTSPASHAMLGDLPAPGLRHQMPR
jgi:hypothetical protein